MIDKYLKELDHYFIDLMRMDCLLLSKDERFYEDDISVITITFNNNQTIRICIAFYKEHFSKTFNIADQAIENYGNIISFNGEILNNWLKVKKINIRDDKINEIFN